MRIRVVAVGRVREPGLRSILDEYYSRIRRYATIDEVELRDETPPRLAAAMEKSIRAGGDRARAVALDVRGRSLTSEALARWLGAMLDDAVVPTFLIGGADGLPQAQRDAAHERVSLGPLTLPHRLARIVLAEQIYRSFTILRGEPYARES